MKRIMVIEDNRKIREELCVFLSKNGYECLTVEDFENTLEAVFKAAPHLIILDINLPEKDGYHITREIRKKSDVPIIVVTSRDTEVDEIISMNLGADDFISKPYNTQVLLAHIETIFRRVYRETPQDRLNCGDFTVNLSRSTFECRNNVYELTRNEIKILTCLYLKKGSIISRDGLMKYLWDSDLFIDDNTLTVNVARLRRKLEEAGLPGVIETRRGQGYIMI